MKAEGFGSAAAMLDISKIKRNKLFGRVAVFAILLGAVHCVKDAYDGPPITPLLDAGISFALLGCYLLYRRGHITLARIIGLTFMNLTFAFYACLVPEEVGVYLFYFPLIAISAAIFGTEERVQRYFFMGFSAACLFALFATDFSLTGNLSFPVESPRSDFYINLGSSAVVLVMCINFILQIGRETEQAFYNLATEIKVQNQHLEKTNEELDRFLYSTSHDLRAPLMSIKGLVNIALRESDVDVVKMYLNMMMERSDKLDFFIKDIIDYARNSRTDIECNPLDFDSIIDGVWDTYKFMDGAERIVFNKEVSCDPVCGDRARIMTLFNNLISNAIKYHNPAEEKPFVNVKVVASSQYARITIEDNGIGIAKDRQGRIFEMFYRAHDYSKGSGLGLYIVKEVVDKLNGTVRVTSTPFKGTTFTLVLPVKPSQSETQTEQPIAEQGGLSQYLAPVEASATKSTATVEQAS